MKKTKGLHVWLFFGAVYLLSGLFYIPILASGEGVYTALNKILIVGVVFTPSVLGVLFVTWTRDKPARQDFWRRIFRFPSTSPGVIWVTLCVMPIVNTSAFILAKVIAGEQISFDYGVKMLSQLPLLLQFLVVEFFLGAVSEELGWRGYALDELQTRYSALTSSVIIGVIWALWHSPAFLIPGLSQYEIGGIFSLNYFCMMAAVIAGSILHTWSYNNSGRSIALSGILLHFVQNATMIFLAGIFDQFDMPVLFWPLSACFAVCVAGFLVWRFGAESLVIGTQHSIYFSTRNIIQ